MSAAIHGEAPLRLGREDARGRARTDRSALRRRGGLEPEADVVKYQSADVAQSGVSIAAIVPPTTGSTQRGCERSWTKNTFTTKTP